jgi:teichuronic acid biosynthesis glycosyltransferase TuaG
LDGTVQHIKNWQENDDRICLLCNNKNIGPGPSRNLAIEKSKGKFIAFLDSDDIWLPEKLETQVRIMTNRDAVISFTSYETIDEKGDPIGKVIQIPDQLSYESLLRNTVMGCLTVMIDKSKYSPIKMPNISCRQPLVLWLKILRETGPAIGIPKILARYRVRSNSISSNKYIAAKQVWKVYRKYENLSLLKSLICFTCYAINGYKRNLGLKR